MYGYPEIGGFLGVGPCTCPLRINIAGAPVDRHRDKKAWMRGLAWHPRHPFIPRDHLTAGRVRVPRLCRLPARAASHHSWGLTLLSGVGFFREVFIMVKRFGKRAILLLG